MRRLALLIPGFLLLVASSGYAAEKTAADRAILADIMSRINFNWAVPFTVWHGTRSVTACIDLDPQTGQLVNVEICDGSGDRAYDASLVKAVRKSAPFAIPAEQLPRFKKLKLTFKRAQP